MANAQVFTCNYGGSIKNKLLKSGEKLFLKIEDGKISGKAFICNEEGRNGYIDNFDYPINDVREVFKGEYQGNTALIMNTRLIRKQQQTVPVPRSSTSTMTEMSILSGSIMDGVYRRENTRI